MKELKLVIFDMDGVTLDTERLCFEAWRRAAVDHDYEIDEPLYISTVGITTTESRKTYLKALGNHFPLEAVENKMNQYRDELILQNGVPIKTGVVELLDYLSDRGIKKAVATSTSKQKAHRLLKEAKLHPYFDYILCGDEVSNSKPDPEIYLSVAKKFDCTPDECLVLEDSPAGVLAASRAGMRAILIPDMREPDEETEKRAHMRVVSLHEVKETIQQLLEN